VRNFSLSYLATLPSSVVRSNIISSSVQFFKFFIMLFFIVSILTRAQLANTVSPADEWMALLFRFQKVQSLDVTHGGLPS